MYYSKLLIPTLRDDPADAETVSHKLMLRAGLIRKVAAGIYSLLPLGLRVLSKVEKIVREEMEKAGAQEILLPALQPAELWQETGRWHQYGKELMRLQDRHAREFCLGPTHEEVVTDLVRREVRSYKQLPLNLYQIQTKFRDEIRPRFGLMRGREFLMKDAYSFDADVEGAKKTYQAMYDAYHHIFRRVGLHFRAVEADTGAIGGSSSHEFMVLAQTGEDAIVSCQTCDYAANMEQAAVSEAPAPPARADKVPPMEAVSTPGKKSIEEVSAFLKMKPSQLLKTLFFQADGSSIRGEQGDKRLVAVLVRGNHEINEIKLKKLLGAGDLTLADGATVASMSKGPTGFSGPVGLKGIEILADRSVRTDTAYVIGANKEDTHLLQALPGRDFTIDRVADLRNVTTEDRCPRCGGVVSIDRGIEVGHVFMLGTKYSETMNATFLDQNGKSQHFVMGCYGIGVSRIVAAAVEQNHDERGIIWPQHIAPFDVEVIPVQEKKAEVVAAAEHVMKALKQNGLHVLFEDRKERAGVKFNDADLLGIPYQVMVSERNLEEGLVELKDRKTGEKSLIALDEIVKTILKKYAS